MNARQPHRPEGHPAAREEAAYRAACAAHAPLCADPRCLTDAAHWGLTVAAQREVERTYAAWQRALHGGDEAETRPMIVQRGICDTDEG